MVMFLRSQAKRQREEAERENKKDKISELPEPLIHHIFSFLPIKIIVSTSILSKRWRYLWTSIAIIDLRPWRWPDNHSCIGESGVREFMRFVDRLLSFRQDVDSPPVRKFYLRSDFGFDRSRVNGWISTVLLHHKLEKLVLGGPIPIIIPQCLFTHESLTKLVIDTVVILRPLETVNFPKLKILRLRVFLDDEHTIPKLLSNSPMLEELYIDVYNGGDIPDLYIHSHNLKRLFIGGPYEDPSFDIQINTPNVQSFKFHSFFPKDFVLQKFTTLLDAEISLSYFGSEVKWEEWFHLATKLFTQLSGVKCLRVSDISLMFLSYQDELITKLPSFCNLINLEVTNTSSGWEYRNIGMPQCRIVETLLDFLNVSPNLESLVFDDRFFRWGWDKPDYNDPPSVDSIPKCLLLHLKSIEFCGLWWNQFEKDLIRFFLKNAKVLQRVRITIKYGSSFTENRNYKKTVLDEISLFPRSSADCVLRVS